MGARVKESWVIFRSEGDVGISTPSVDGATTVAKTLGMGETNQIQSIGGAVANANLLWTNGGGKSISYLPKVRKLYMEIAG
jgi:hypothetical protein